MSKEAEEKVCLPHHEQQKLCTTRLPYRQGRKLTAVKVYTINNESNHLLIFGVPSLNLRQEARSLFSKFGKLAKFTISPEHPAEAFTETYHAIFEDIQTARIAKRMIDTKNFYGGSLHVCYAPELETIQETRQKILQRKQSVAFRIKKLQREKDEKKKVTTIEMETTEKVKMNMGEVNTIFVGKQIRDVVMPKRKNKNNSPVIEKKFKPCFVKDNNIKHQEIGESSNRQSDFEKKITENKNNEEIEIINFTSTEVETISNINDELNYNNFGNEIVRNIENKPLNKIKFNFVNKKS